MQNKLQNMGLWSMAVLLLVGVAAAQSWPPARLWKHVMPQERVNLARKAIFSPTVGTGSTLASTYQLDVWGRLQAQFRAGWDMGATVLVPIYLGLKPGH
jgi:hypothetical protein